MFLRGSKWIFYRGTNCGGRLMQDNKRGDVLRYIVSFSAEHHYPPTVKEIMEALGFSSTSMVQYYVDQLREEGQLTSEPGKARTLVANESVRTTD
jgi:repressor LexA